MFVTTDRNIRYQQNLSARKIAIAGLSKGSWPLINNLSDIASAVAAAAPGSMTEIEIAIE